MQHLFQSTFLQALGYAIANSLWQTALVWLVYMSITGLLSISAAAKYRWAVAAQVTGFIWFLVTFQFYYRQYSNAWQHSGAVPVSQDIQAIVSSNTDLSSRMINFMVKGEQLLPYVSMAYLLLMLFLCTRWFLGYRQTQLIRNNGLQKMPADWRLFVKKIAAQLGIKNEIQVFLSATVNTPLTVGFLKPVILIPVASINHLTTDQLEAVLLHELAHIKRYDYLVNIILSVVEISLFFNPFTQLLSKSIRKERENSCDDWVLQFKYNATVYAEALLRIAYLQTPAFAMAASGKKKNDLLVRVKRMIEKKENRFSYRRQLLAFFIVTGILCSIAWLNPIASHSEQKTVAGNQKKILKNVRQYALEPMAVNVDNPLFNPVFFLSKPLKAEMKKNIASAQKEMDEAVFESKKTPRNENSFVESFSPFIADAFEQASATLAMENTDWKKNSIQMDIAKKEIEKVFRDSAFMPLKMQHKLKDDINGSMQHVGAEMEKAKKEMVEEFKLAPEMPYINKNMLQQEMLKGMEAVEQLRKAGLDKLILTSLRLPGLFFNDAPKQRMEKFFPVTLVKENSKMKMQKSLKETELLLEKETDEDNDIDQPIRASSDVIQPLPSAPQLEKWMQDVTNMVRITASIAKSSKENKMKIAPQVAKEKRTDDKKFTFLFQ